MTPSDELFLLIRSLSKNEKGYFKKYASKHVVGSGNNYIRLFDAIERQKEYDEEQIRKIFRKETFIRHLPSEKNYLYHLILRALGEFHSESSSEKKLRDLVHSIELLYDKGLFLQCNKLLSKAKKIAAHYEKPLIQLHLHEWESKILKSLADLGAFEIFMQESRKQQKQWLKQFDNFTRFRRLEEDIFLLSKKFGFPRSHEEKKRYEKIIRDPLMKNGRNALSFRSTLHFYNISSYYNELLGKQNETYHYRKMLVDFAEKKPHLINDDQQRYVMALNNLLNSQDELGLREDCEQTIAKLHQLKTRSPNIKARVFGYTWNIRMTQQLNDGEFRELVGNAKEVKEGLKQHGRLLHPEFLLAFKYQFFYGYFGAEKFKDALTWMNQLLNDDTAQVRPEIYFFGRIMNLILHFEMKNQELLAYEMRSTYRLFIRQKRLYKFETIMLTFIRRSGKYTTPRLMREAFIDLKKQLESIRNDPYEKQILGFFDIISWLESKITKRSFEEVVNVKMKKN
ncbi:MAG: hypothetical protein HY064_07325 [Bacteroidetes bacterium]|nr:hypothetical protein [Bacteroidota bacterium]